MSCKQSRCTWRCLLLLLGCSVLLSAPLKAEFDLGFQVMGRWDTGAQAGAADLKNVELLTKGGWTAVLLPWPADAAARAFADGCDKAGITPIAELGVMESAQQALQAAEATRAAGFAAIALDAAGAFDKPEALRDFVKELRGYDALVFLTRDQIGWDVPGAHLILKAGLWPGVRSPPNVEGRGIEVATASREPWVDSNAYLLGYLRGMFPDRPAALSYRADAAAGISDGRAVPYESLEVALVEAKLAGGNVVLSVEDDYRRALLSGDAEAGAAWESLGKTARFLRQNRDALERPNRSRIAVSAGTPAESGEILNLLYRRNLFPLVYPIGALPVLDSSRVRALVAANIPAPGRGELRRIEGYVRAGGLLVAAPSDRATPAWWLFEGVEKTSADRDRDQYSFGSGRIVAYHDPILDPSEFALDVIDLVGVRVRDLRLWNAPAVVGLAAQHTRSSAQVHLINYDTPLEQGFPARVDGIFRTATLRDATGETRPLKAVKRGEMTEVWIDRLGRLAIIDLH